MNYLENKSNYYWSLCNSHWMLDVGRRIMNYEWNRERGVHDCMTLRLQDLVIAELKNTAVR